jgi:hypothetical protein
MATDDTKTLTPTAAVARHVEWLEYALAAARDEEVRRQGRLDRATDKNREKRQIRLAEVTAEVRELGALVSGLKVLQTRATRLTAGPKRKAASATAKRAAAATTTTRAASTSKPVAAKSKAPTAKPAAKASAPTASTAKPATKAKAAPKASASRSRTRSRTTRS